MLWVSSWYDPAKEADSAKALIDQGADIIASITDSPAALQACEQRGLMAFGQGWDMSSFAPKAHLTAIQNKWGVYYIKRVQAVLDGSWSSGDSWWGHEGWVSWKCQLSTTVFQPMFRPQHGATQAGNHRRIRPRL